MSFFFQAVDAFAGGVKEAVMADATVFNEKFKKIAADFVKDATTVNQIAIIVAVIFGLFALVCFCSGSIGGGLFFSALAVGAYTLGSDLYKIATKFEEIVTMKRGELIKELGVATLPDSAAACDNLFLQHLRKKTIAGSMWDSMLKSIYNDVVQKQQAAADSASAKS